MKEIGRMMRGMDLENRLSKMELHSQGSGKKGRFSLAHFNFLKNILIMENIKRARFMVQEHYHYQMRSFLVNSGMVS